MKKLFALVVALAFAGVANAQYDLAIEPDAANYGAGATINAAVTLDSSAGDNIAGWSFGVQHDPAAITLNGVVDGATTATVNGGNPPDFNQVNLLADGWTVGVVISFLGSNVLAPGAGYELNVADYTNDTLTEAALCTDLAFVSTLGSPAVSTVVVVGGQSVVPSQTGATVCGQDTPPPFFVSGNASVSLNGSPASFSVTHQIDDSLGQQVTQGFSMAMGNDAAVIAPTAVSTAGVVSDLNGGSGPDFNGPATFADGWTIGIVYSFLGSATIVFDTPQDVISTDYDVVAADQMALDGTSTDLEWVDGVLGNPPVVNVVVVGGNSVGAGFTNGAVDFTFQSTSDFISGDCNDDGIVNIADGVYIIGNQNPGSYAAGLYGIDCNFACDANGDSAVDLSDAVYVIMYRFQDGAAPAAPFPACGQRAGQTPDDCLSHTSCP